MMNITCISPADGTNITAPKVVMAHPEKGVTTIYGVYDFAPHQVWVDLRHELEAHDQDDATIMVFGIRSAEGERAAAHKLRETLSFMPLERAAALLADTDWDAYSAGVHLQGLQVENVDVTSTELLSKLPKLVRLKANALALATSVATKMVDAAGGEAAIKMLGSIMSRRGPRGGAAEMKASPLTSGLWEYWCTWRAQKAAQKRHERGDSNAAILWEDDMVSSLVHQFEELGWTVTNHVRTPWGRITDDGSVASAH